MRNNRVTLDDIQQLKNRFPEFIEMQHAVRINGCIDIYLNGFKVYDKKRNKYLSFDSKQEAIKQASILAEKYGVMSAFKKTKKGKMTYKEFKYNKRDSLAEYYHWKNNKEKSSDSLYFIKCGIYVKIGRSKNILNRIKQLSTGMPEKAVLLASFNNLGCIERTMHRCFKELKTKEKGEWFFYNDRIKSFIKWAKERDIDTDKLRPETIKSKETYYLDSFIPFGKYKGKKISEVKLIDLSYLNWLSTVKSLDKDIFDN